MEDEAYGSSTSDDSATQTDAEILIDYLGDCPDVPLNSFALQCALKVLEAVDSWLYFQTKKDRTKKDQNFNSIATRSMNKFLNDELKTLEESYRGIFGKDGVCKESCSTGFLEAATLSGVGKVRKRSSGNRTAGRSREDTVEADVKRPKTSQKIQSQRDEADLERAVGAAFVAEARQQQPKHSQQHQTQQLHEAVVSPQLQQQYAQVTSPLPIMEGSAILGKLCNETKYPRFKRRKMFMQPNSLFTSIRLTTSSDIKHQFENRGDSGRGSTKCALCTVRVTRFECSDCKVSLCTTKGNEQESCMVVWHKRDVDLISEGKLREERERQRRQRRRMNGGRTKKQQHFCQLRLETGDTDDTGNGIATPSNRQRIVPHKVEEIEIGGEAQSQQEFQQVLRSNSFIREHPTSPLPEREISGVAEAGRTDRTEQPPQQQESERRRLFKLLNLESSEYDDQAVIEEVRRNPDAAKKKDKFTAHDTYGEMYPLTRAVILGGSFEAVEALYEAYPDAIKDTENVCSKRTVLHWACTYYSGAPVEVVRMILERHPPAVEMKDSDGRTPLHLACDSGSSEVVGMILETYPLAVEVIDSYGRTPLHCACRMVAPLEVVRMLLERYPSALEMKDSAGRTPLHSGCRGGASVDVIRMLLEGYPSALEMKDSGGYTPLMAAEKFHTSPEVIEMLRHALESRT